MDARKKLTMTLIALLGMASPALAGAQEVPSPAQPVPPPSAQPSPAAAPADLEPAARPAGEAGSQAGDLGLGRRIPIGAYGEAQLVHQGDRTEATLERFVLFLGYRFADWARLYSEIEVEDGHEVEMEQAYLELSSSKRFGLRAGLLIVPLGIINTYHEPPTFNGVSRPAVDKLIIPTTWRELGAGVFGEVADGLHYQLYVMNGLDASKFSPELGIGPGRGQGVGDVQSKDAAVSGRLNYNGVLGLDVGAGFYFGGAGQSTPELGGVKVGIVEADARFSRGGLQLRAEYARVFISGADRITNLQRVADPAAPAVGSAEQGFYLEAGYNVLRFLATEQELVPFVRYENVNTRASLPNVLALGTSEALQFVTAGLTYRPHPQIVFKLDYRRTVAGQETEAGEALDANRLSLGIGFMY